MYYEAQRLQQGERCFCTALPRQGALHSSVCSEGCSALESSGVFYRALGGCWPS